jgi:hypothetical protein
MVLESTPGWIVAVWFCVSREKLERSERSMIHPPDEIVDQGLLPPDLMTVGILALTAL